MANPPRRLPRSLRLGVAQRGRIVQETLIPPGGRVLLGSDPRRATVVVEPGTVPRRGHTLLINRPGAACLHLRPGMTGKVARDERIADLARLVDARGRVPLGVRDRGKVRVGDTTLLFQFVETPPLPQPMHWSKRVAAETDTIWTATLLFSAALHAAAVVWLSVQPPPPEDVWVAKADRITVWVDHLEQDVAEQMAQELIEGPSDDASADAEPEPKDEPDEPDAADEPEAPDEPGGEADAPDDAPGGDPAPPMTDAERYAANLDKVKGTGLIAIIGTAGESSMPGAVRDLVASAGVFDERIGDAVAEARAVPQSRDGDYGLRSGGSATDAVVGISDRELDGPGGGEGGRVQKRQVEPIANEPTGGPIDVDPTADGVDELRAEIKQRVRRFKACYERILKQDDPDLGGTIRLSWTVEANGRVSGQRVLSDTTGSAALQQCVLGRLRALNFSARDEAVEIESYPVNFSRQ